MTGIYNVGKKEEIWVSTNYMYEVWKHLHIMTSKSGIKVHFSQNHGKSLLEDNMHN